ncbi:MAG: hypothetical protein RIM23_25760 [Coleofasciculus sp. G3-WIS-01]|uniref:hypothetical protein n=1 Tax=Coleofasciculus sp. G3-WIS-01 TaxID=3069528 RepID=UPI0032F0C562
MALNALTKEELKERMIRDGKKILEQVGKTIKRLKELKLSQGDVRIDNIGCNAEGQYILFDYNGLRAYQRKTEQEDINHLIGSIIFNGYETLKKEVLNGCEVETVAELCEVLDIE